MGVNLVNVIDGKTNDIRNGYELWTKVLNLGKPGWFDEGCDGVNIHCDIFISG